MCNITGFSSYAPPIMTNEPKNSDTLSGMSILSVNKLSLTQGIKRLFESASFGIDSDDKIAVIGPNGSGKTTLLSLIAQSLETPQAEISIQSGLRISMLTQTPNLNPEHSIREHLYKSNTEASLAIQNYNQQLEYYQQNASTKTEANYTAALEKMDHLNLWEYEERVSSLLNELKIDQLDQKIKHLSGGMCKKIALAQVFIEETDLLILDEPTNHLDITTIEWLEGMLKKQRSALLMVTHDRYFLDNVCNKILEIDQEKIFVYRGNYKTYLEQFEQRHLAQARQESRIQSILRVELEWLKRGPKARSTKQKARKDRIKLMMNRDVITAREVLALDVSKRRLGKKILELKNVHKSFNALNLIYDFSFSLNKGDRIGILGPNGVGKSTLLNLIMGKLHPDLGEIDIGINTVFGYFDQHSGEFNLNHTIYEHVSNIGTQFTRPDGSTVSSAKLLEQFLFPSTMLSTVIKKLSGGERRRLHLVCLLLKNPNVLLFDEPTNDLDIQTLSVLEDFLLSFSGCVIIISHDRYFMDRVVNQLLIFNNDREIVPFRGNYSDYMDTLKDIEDLKKLKVKPKQNSKIHPNKSSTKEIKKIEKKINQLETEKKSFDAIFCSPDSTPADYAEAGKKIKLIEQQLNDAYTHWEALLDQG